MPSLALACRLSAVSMTLRQAYPGAFDPASLFANGEQGLWYDVGDFDRYMSKSGPELVTNGDFSDGITDWVKGSGTTSPLSWDSVGQRLVVTNDLAYYASGTILVNGLTVGRTYKVSGTCSNNTVRVRLGVAFGGSALVNIDKASSGTKAVSFSFVATATSVRIECVNVQNTLGGVAYWDNISVRELTAITTATLFQDTAGTTPVTAVEQPVGLILDKRLHRFDGSLAWTKTLGDGAVTVNGGLITITGATTETRVNAPGRALFNGMVYMRVRYVNTGSATNPIIWVAGVPTVPVSGQTYPLSFNSSNSNLERVQIASGNATFEILGYYFLPGNHAYQATTTARGVLRARYNLLTYSEDFSNAAWIKTGSPILTSQGAGVWRLQAAAGSSWLLYQNIPRPNTETCKFSIEVKSNGAGLDAFRSMMKGTVTQNFTASADWQKIEVIGLNDGSGSVGIINRDNTAIDILIRFPDLRPANLQSGLPAYQRIAEATDYDTVGFPVYIDIDGTDDSYVTGSIDFSGTGKMTIWAGLRKVDDTARMLCELSTNLNVLNGSFTVVTGNEVNSFYQSSSRANATSTGSLAAKFATGLYPAPDSAVITAQHDIAGDLSCIRRNGSSYGAIDSTADKGTGNFGNYPMYLFSRGAKQFFWKGHFYGLIIRGASTETTPLEQTEQWINTRMGGYL